MVVGGSRDIQAFSRKQAKVIEKSVFLCNSRRSIVNLIAVQ